jgi:serine phosphatase RsbU (regulator of sigma subunit)
VASVAQIRGRYLKRKWVGSVAPTTREAGRPYQRALEDQLASLGHERDDLRRSMYEAAQVQRRLCGPRHLRAGSYEIASEIFPVRHLSGDFINLSWFGDDLVFAIGDIAGKGLMAAMWFTHVVGMIRRQILELGDPAAALSAVDRDLLCTGFEFPLTTVFLARLNLESGELTYCNAGHPPALLIGENREVQELRAGGPVLGAISSASFVNGAASLRPGNTLLAYSDGIAESRNESGIEFGTEGLLKAARAFSDSCSDGMLFSVLAAVENFVGSQHRDDDIALMVLNRLDSCKIDG